MNVKQIHEAIKQGKTLHWHNELYVVDRHPVRTGRYKEYDLNHDSYFDGHVLHIWCPSTSFGGMAESCELKDVYIKGNDDE